VARLGQRWLAAGWSLVRFSWGASMDHGATAQQGGGPENRSRKRGDVEAGAHRRNDDTRVLQRGMRWLGGAGSSSWARWGSLTCAGGVGGGERGHPRLS
jgi:hypothetical protein